MIKPMGEVNAWNALKGCRAYATDRTGVGMTDWLWRFSQCPRALRQDKQSEPCQRLMFMGIQALKTTWKRLTGSVRTERILSKRRYCGFSQYAQKRYLNTHKIYTWLLFNTYKA
ncbi:hypothetical protein [Pseudomonas sp. MF6787]|uniref:hypothetical protein n=1 Tax=Pseudomonas sp. MF6787 TaxID=2797536 RepID=UPI0018E73D39|nr:hypothetical protein [Pseudomonas sp. MF6787]MBJ2265568.1 hypothetical protein [Pseudomonas sp. MF6787]